MLKPTFAYSPRYLGYVWTTLVSFVQFIANAPLWSAMCNLTHEKSCCVHWKWGKCRQDLKCLKCSHINQMVGMWAAAAHMCVFVHVCFFPFNPFDLILLFLNKNGRVYAHAHVTNTDAYCFFFFSFVCLFRSIRFFSMCVLHFQIKATTKTAITPCHKPFLAIKLI